MSSFIDLDSGKIIGCRKRSPTWYHEKGHLAFSKTNKAIRFDFFKDYFLKGAILFICLDLFLNNWIIKFIALFCIMKVIAYDIYEELWCWKFAYNRKNRWIKYINTNHWWDKIFK